MPRKIIIVRHGETDYNVAKILQGHLDTLLNINGYLQAKTVAEKLKSEKIDVIIASDLKRTYHTALMIAQEQGKKVIETTLLRERHFGVLEGNTFSENKKIFWCFGYESDEMNRLVEEKSQAYGVENNIQMKVRLNELLKQIKKYKNKTIVLVTHGGTMRELIKLFGHKITGSIKNTECFYLEKNKDGTYLFHRHAFS